MTPLNNALYFQGRYRCVHCRKFGGNGCNTEKAKYMRTDCTRVLWGRHSCCSCNHRGGFIEKTVEKEGISK